MDNLLEIKNLHARIGDKEILRGIDLSIAPGQVHAVMGPNGAGKSTLSAVLTGRPDYEVTEGSILYRGQDLLALTPEERSWAGIFLSFQYPIEIPGVTITAFMKAAVNARRKAQGQAELKAGDFLKLMKEKMALLDPVLSILDETDSGLDVDALKIVADGVNTLRSPLKSAIIITHYHKLLEYVQPDVVHVLKDGRIACTGGRELIDAIETKGFDQF